MDSPPKNKRIRKVNWMPIEVDILIQEVEKNHHILFSAFCNTVTNVQKKKIWTDIAQKICANSLVKRDEKDIKKKWTDIKSQARRKAASLKREICATGGGPPPQPLNEVEERIVSLIPSCQIDGCEGGLESDVNEFVPEDLTNACLPDEQSVFVIQPSPPQLESQQKAAVVQTVLAVEGQIPTTGDKLMALEERKVQILQQLLTVELQRLNIEERNLAINERNLKINEEKLLLKQAEKNVQCLSPLISFHH
ncbi:uncharacterized protein LOC124147755 [Haliotis rufescens]|uniref:uncharacterized protein LOC124147755 n=1 Tax=Haliotis rufescens TaxID=6454 RepID=UPI001EB0366F|nr:uncharacterized protein LOC124147755 [Haliotis rufescens]